MANQNILSIRYATEEINNMFSEKGKILSERELWIAVMKAQQELGLNIHSEEIEKFEKAKKYIDLEEIKKLEKFTQHDVKARIENFVKVANGKECLHLGMTSRDLTDNVEQMQIKKASQIIFGKYVSVLRHLLDKAKDYREVILTAKTHHQPAQPTLLGKRFSMWAEELYFNLNNLENFIQNYPLRGIKGAVGTQLDMLTLLGSQEKVEILENKVAELLGFKEIFNSPGQVYSRSLDYTLISNLAACTSATENFAKSVRLMAGSDLVTEGFQEGRVGSSAMPHKMNTSHCERICSLSELMKMYADGASRLSGDQWEEGDVSCSVLRRVIIPDSFYVSDGVCETTLNVLNQMGIYEKVIKKELNKYLPFLATSKILALAVEKGIGREEAHKVIKDYAVKEALNLRNSGNEKNNLARLISENQTFIKAGIDYQSILKILKDKESFLGNAKEHICAVIFKAQSMIERYPQEARYEGKEII